MSQWKSFLVVALFLVGLTPTTATEEEEQTRIHPFDILFDDYHEYYEVVSELQRFANDYPDIVEFYTLTDMIPAGQTWQGNEIVGIKISDNVANEPAFYDDPDENSILILGSPHGREWMPVVTSLYYAYYLTHYYGMEPTDNDGDGLVNEDWIDGVDNDGDGERGGRVDEYGRALFDGIDNDGDGLIDEGIDEDIIEERVTYIVDNYEIWVIPILNPDGYMYDRDDPSRFWRKNMRDNDQNDRYGDDCDGVDLNRNFPLHWNNSSSFVSYNLDSLEQFTVDDDNICSDVYHGPRDFNDDDGDGLVDEDDEDSLREDSDDDGLLDEDRSGGFSEPETQVIEYLFWRLDIYEDYPQDQYLEDYQNGIVRNNWPDMFVQNDDGETIRNYQIERLSYSHNIKSAVSYHSYGSLYVIPSALGVGPLPNYQNHYDNLLTNMTNVTGYGDCRDEGGLCVPGGSFIDWAHYNHGVFSLAVQLNSNSQGEVVGGFHADPVLIQPTSRMHLLTNIEILNDDSFMNNFSNQYLDFTVYSNLSHNICNIAEITFTAVNNGNYQDTMQVRIANLQELEDAGFMLALPAKQYLIGSGSEQLIRVIIDSTGVGDTETDYPLTLNISTTLLGEDTSAENTTIMKFVECQDGNEEDVNETVFPGKPTAIAGADVSISPGDTVQFNGAGTDENGTIVKYEWDFDGDGVYEWSSEENGRTTNIYNNAGTYTPTLRVTDDSGMTATDSLTVTVKSPEEEEGRLPSLSLLAIVTMLGIVSILKRR
jgi:plastocyanin